MASRLTPARLALADKQAEEKAKEPRAARLRVLEQFVGDTLMQAADRKRRPINATTQALNTMRAALTPEYHGYRVTAHRIDLRAEADLREAALKRIADKQKLAQLYEDVLFDALTGAFGITLTGLRAGAQMVKIDDEDIDPGQLFVKRVDLDDYAVDPMARHRSEAYWERHKYRCPRWLALESGVFRGHEDLIMGLPGLDELRGKSTRARDLSGNEQYDEDSNVCDLIELCDYAIYEPSGTRIVTLPVRQDGVDGSGVFLLDIGYEGPDDSPYNVLQFFGLPDNVYGPSLASMFADLSDALDTVGSKMIREGSKSKRVFAAEKAAAEDAETILKAGDLDVVLVDDIEALKDFDVGGVQKDLYQFFAMMRTEFNNASMSSQLVGGQESIGGTATEASILQGNANQSLAWMRRKMAAFLNRDGRRLAWWMHNDPLISLPMPYRLRGGEWITVDYTPEMRQGDFGDFLFEYTTDSMQTTDPAVKAKRTQEALATFTQGLQAISAVGGDVTAWARIIGEQFGVEELDEVVNGPDFHMRQMAIYAGLADPGKGSPTGMAGQDPAQAGGVPRGTGPQVAGPGATSTAQVQSAYAPAMAGGV